MAILRVSIGIIALVASSVKMSTGFPTEEPSATLAGLEENEDFAAGVGSSCVWTGIEPHCHSSCPAGYKPTAPADKREMTRALEAKTCENEVDVTLCCAIDTAAATNDDDVGEKPGSPSGGLEREETSSNLPEERLPTNKFFQRIERIWRRIKEARDDGSLRTRVTNWLLSKILGDGK